jgi:sulfite reductase beta subunit-like hemoprotein
VPHTRDRRDRCPGALRPWPADDGLLVRLRLVGGRITSSQLRALVTVAETHADGRVHPTSRANLQVRGFSSTDGRLDTDALSALESTGLLPSPTHELVRNVMVSPQTGLAGGRADLRIVAAELDRLLCAENRLARLPGRFLFVLDDGRGDLVDRGCDLGLAALDATTAQVRAGPYLGPHVDLAEAPRRLVQLAHRFLDARGEGESAPWHVAELDRPLFEPAAPDPRVPRPTAPLPFGEVRGGHHVAVRSTGLARDAVHSLTENVTEVVVTPWRGVLVPRKEPRG